MSRWEEVFGYVNAEAMATAKPLVGTQVGGIPEIIDHGNTGFLVERRDTAAMAARILELLRDPNLRHRMGEAGRRVATEKFNHKTNVAQLIQLYGL
jgi:glycosyltransferase involved in cell wall biosynthesis